ncbi:MAG: trypsin-like peptidase domain-containing protein [Acidobacteria bacterium]|nr:trypsin-like peptidase domain-containing protein [Acidobacteriota bacterium]
MKFRTLVLALLIAGGFIWVTTTRKWDPPSFLRTTTRASGSLWSGPSVQGAGLSSDEQNNIDIYKTAHHATVNISSTVYRRGWFGQIVPEPGTGSGFLIDGDGRILTNYHVVSGRAPEVVVTLPDKTRYKATILVRDPSNDLALIKIQPKGKVSFLRLGDSDNLQVGQKVLAIGNPFGLEGTLTTGIISSLGRQLRDENERVLEGMIQTDAAINPGNSGGPLLDSQGNVIGINTAIYGPGGNIGIGFAMPVNRAKSMLEDFQAGRKFGRPWLGVTVLPVFGDLAELLELPKEGGLLIQEVGQGTGADEAGLRGARRFVIVGNTEVGIGGDLIMELDGQKVDRGDALSRALARKRPGDTMNVTIYRAGRQTTVKVTLGERPEERY